jgi:hypothetical protein
VGLKQISLKGLQKAQNKMCDLKKKNILSSSVIAFTQANSYPFIISLGWRPMTKRCSAFLSNSPPSMITIFVESPIWKGMKDIYDEGSNS